MAAAVVIGSMQTVVMLFLKAIFCLTRTWNQDDETRAQSCGSRTMQCLDPAAVEETPATCADVRRTRALRLDATDHEVRTEN